MEQADAAERHGDTVLVAGINDLAVADGAARLHNGGHAAAARALNVVAKGEEGIAAQGYAGHLVQPGALFLGGQRLGLAGEGLGPDIITDDILRRFADIDINGVVAVGLGNILAEGQAQHLRHVAQLPVVGLLAGQTGAVYAALLPGADTAAAVAEDANGNPVEIAADPDAPLCAYVFKTVADPFVGKLSFIKVLSGKLTATGNAINSRTGQPERLGKTLTVCGKKQTDTAAILTGDIGAVAKLTTAKTGDTLCDPARVVSLPAPVYPIAGYRMAVKVAKKGDEGKVSGALTRLMEEDPAITFEVDPETKQQVIGGLGTQHLEVALAKLKNKFGVEITLEAPRVPYRESIRKSCKAQGRHKKQTGGHGQFGDVWIQFEPVQGEAIEFAENVFGGSVPKNFFPAVEKGVRQAAEHGVLAGYPMVGLKATLLDGSYHPVDSSEMAFVMAAKLAYKAAIPEAGPVLLEPIGSLQAHVPADNTGDIMGEVTKRRGRVLGMNPDDDGMQVVVAEVPMAEMQDFTTFLRQLTQGRGWFTFTFTRYETLPQMLESKVIEQAKALGNFADEE